MRLESGRGWEKGRAHESGVVRQGLGEGKSASVFSSVTSTLVLIAARFLGTVPAPCGANYCNRCYVRYEKGQEYTEPSAFPSNLTLENVQKAPRLVERVRLSKVT